MKKTLIIVMLVWAAMTACKKEEPEPFRLDPNATVLIRGVVSIDMNTPKSVIPGLTPLDVVEQAYVMCYRSHWMFLNDDVDIDAHTYSEEAVVWTRGIDEKLKDFDIPALKMMGYDIIGPNGALVKDFLYAFDVFIADANRDTIAYVPQSIIESARVQIETAFYGNDYEEVYRLFDEAFVFLPMDEL